MADIDDLIEELKQKRDELRVQIHLASKEVQEEWDELMSLDREKLKLQTLSHEELFLQLFDHLPKEMIFTRELFSEFMVV